MNTMGERIVQIAKHNNLTATNFARRLGYAAPQKINRIFNNPEQTNPSADMLCDIANAFTEINCFWLLTGKGAMFISEPMPVPYQRPAADNQLPGVTESNWQDERVRYMQQIISSKDLIIELLQNQINDLKNG